MRSVASLEVDEARELLERLKKETIPAELKTTTQESGLEISDVLVEDDYYNRACDVADAWEAEKAEQRSARRCPKCGSRHLEYIPDDRLEYIYRCKDCGSDIVFKR